LAFQALLPFFPLLGAAGLVLFLPERRQKGILSAAATALASAIVVIELLRLAPGARVDIPYLKTFPYADLSVRLDALSLAFAFVTLATAAFLMLLRLQVRDDRRDPWFAWLITSAASLAVILAGNLLLLYAALQLLTLAWSGALDESARRQRALRLVQQLAGLGLLAAAAWSVRAVDTSAFSGVPSDTLGPLPFALALLPVFSAIGALALGTHRPQERIRFEPAIAWAAPAGYLALRLLSLSAGRPPGQLVSSLLFAVCLVAAALLAAVALWEGPGPKLGGRLLGVQALLALGYSASAIPVMAVASTWSWLLLVPLAGLASVNLPAGSAAAAVRLVALSLAPPSAAFIGIWLGLRGLSEGRFSWTIFPLLAIMLATAAAAAGGLELSRKPKLDLPAIAGLTLVAAGAFPFALLSWLVLPASRAVRAVARGTLRVDGFGLASGNLRWPGAVISAGLACGLAVLLLRYRSGLPLRKPRTDPWRGFTLPSPNLGTLVPAGIRELPWVQITWGLYLAVLLFAINAR
jgi:hypothetical protein